VVINKKSVQWNDCPAQNVMGSYLKQVNVDGDINELIHQLGFTPERK